MNLIQTTKEIQRLIGADDDGIFGPQTAGKVLLALMSAEGNILPPAVGAGMRFDERTERNLSTLRPEARSVMEPFLHYRLPITPQP